MTLATEFFTVVAVRGDGAIVSDTDMSINSHRSVRSYKTIGAARRAIQVGAKIPDVQDYYDEQ
ncbi:hypothetical protein [Mycolicibacterium palauense]|uniref:hypothetical protein n=1 Tax=Mycolicibacterium palauense TaxID=2034511 RepID=UPI000BFEE567|nr:hypothetical protein [Mycolicibacterium palauense]